MKVKVLQGQSVCHSGSWYHQGQILEIETITVELKDKVEAAEAPAQKKNKKEEG